MFLIQYNKGYFVNAEEIITMSTCSDSGFIFFHVKNDTHSFRVIKDYEESFLNALKTLDDNNPGNKLTKHKYK